MRRHHVLELALCVGLSVGLAGSTGCSFAFTKGPSSGQLQAQAAAPTIPPGCTSSMAWPVVDGVIGGLALLSAAGAFDDDTTSNSDRNDRITAGLVIGGVALASAFVGHGRVSKCRQAKETFATQYAQTYGVPYGTYPAGYGYAAQPYSPYAAPQPPAPPVASNPPPPPAPPAPPPPPAKVPAKPAPRPPAKPTPPADALGTEGDVCSTQDECAAGFTCSPQNVCLKQK
ncbi:MAG TPA: hypothetical protein VFQ53_26285 [Kofleriaceae bacterium]|nr:hypothetical protein [Kofleriaceae bacterium]